MYSRNNGIGKFIFIGYIMDLLKIVEKYSFYIEAFTMVLYGSNNF